MKRKWKRALLGATAVIGIAVIGVYAAINYGTNYMLRALVADVHVPPVEKTTTIEPTPSSPDQPPESAGNPSASTDVPGKEAQGNETGTPATTPGTEVNPPAAPSGGKPPGGSGAPEPPQPPSSAPKPEPLTYSAEITPEKAQQAQEHISFSEKAKLTSVLMRKLSASEISLFVKMASGGVSVEDKKEAKKVILQKLSEDEYNELIGIAARLGLSTGRTYDETKKDFE